MDLDALRSAGLYDPAAPGSDERLTLLEFLAGEGCTVEEMQVAQGLGHPGGRAGHAVRDHALLSRSRPC